MYKAIIFDFFDVIRTDLYNAWLKANGLKREGEYHKASQDADSGKITREEFLARISELSGQSVTKETFESGAKVDDAVLAIIQELRPHYRLALLSNSPSSLIRGILAEHDLERYFDEIIVSGEVGHIKPSREIFEIALDRLEIKPSEALFIDDNEHHVAGAEQAGIKSIQFISADQLRRDLAKRGIPLN